MNTLEFLQSKIKSGLTLERQLAYWRFRNEKIVFTNGCFDLLHPGHIEYLAKASDLGDVLIIGLNTDASVKRLKGEGRPIQNQEARALVLAALGNVNGVVFFDEDTPLELIKQIQPDVLVKGGDYEVKDIVGYEEVKAKGGQVLTIPFVDGFSTSGILEKIK
ncbi:MAG: D-glycero-beta-D-manno-heptose 1-phosphate adenylyltransferase [Bacteroidales bacterium]